MVIDHGKCAQLRLLLICCTSGALPCVADAPFQHYKEGGKNKYTAGLKAAAYCIALVARDPQWHPCSPLSGCFPKWLAPRI